LLPTETASPRFADIENWSSTDLLDGMVEGQFAAIAAVRAAQPAIARAIDAATARLAAGGRLIYAGAGTSGRLAALDAAELPPTFSWPYERAVPIMAGGEPALLRAAEGAEDDREAARQALRDLGVNATDVVIALAASGRTPFAIAALEEARLGGALAIGISNNSGSALGEAADIAILLDTGPEFLAGSTRMKAGTAQKVALNCLSTGIMIKLGFVYRGKMVEMRATNVKLRDRAVKMVAELSSSTEDAARDALATADGKITLAVVMLVRALPRDAAEARLAEVGGRLADALK
jgi:N-acetylmuramic acid 6-phosphate etherase